MKLIFKSVVAAAAVLIFSLSQTFAGKTHYSGTLSGADCSSCKKEIAMSIAKIKGVQTIRIVKLSEDKHRLEVITDGSNPVTRKDANKALSKSDHYKIHSWSKKKHSH